MRRLGLPPRHADAIPGVIPAIAAPMTALLLALALAGVLYRYPPPSAELLALGGLGIIGVLALAIARYDAAVAVGFLLLGVVRVEPAPPDLIFTVIVLVAAVTGRFEVKRMPIVVPFSVGLFLALNVLSVIEAVDPNRAAFFMSITLYLAVFSLWLAAYVDSVRRARLVVLCYLAAAVVSAAFGSLALFVDFPGHADLVAYTSTRAAGLFKDPNVFGPFLIPPAIILLQEMLRPRLIGISAPVKLFLFSVLVLGVLLSYSRAAWLNFAVAVAVLLSVLLLRREAGARLAAVACVVLAAAAVSGAVIVTTGSSDLLEQRASVQSYDAARFDAQEAGLGLAAHHPIGIGPGQYEPVVQYAAHNTYIRVFAEQGVLGLAVLAALATATLWLALRNVVRGRSTHGIGSAALLAAWCGLLANSLFVDTLHWRHLWVLAGLIWAGGMQRSAPPRATGAP